MSLLLEMKFSLPRKFPRLKFHRPTWHQVWLALVWVLVIGTIALFSLVIYLERTLPDPQTIATRKVSESTKIYDRTGQVLLYDIHGPEKRTIVPWDQIPEVAREATLAAEDDTFYTHGGFDIKSILRSVLVDLKTMSFSEGGSTITQQLVGNALTGRQKTILRKIEELVLSVEVERQFTKDQIFWMYLNEIPYGSNAYGIQAAAQTFFGKNASDLDVAQAATLASLIQAPSYYSPYGRHIDELTTRKDYVLGRMKDLGYIDDQQYQQALNEQLAFQKNRESILAPHFVIMVKDYLEQKYGSEAVENGGLTVITTLDANLQQMAQDAVDKYVPINKERYKVSNAAMVSVDPKTGDVLDLVGSADYFDVANDGNFNVTIDGPGRQPGSSFKPFAYATLLEKGYPDSTVLFDEKTEFNPNCSPAANQNTDQYGLACYHPSNYDLKFRGPVTLRTALDESLNVPAVKVLYLAGIDDTIHTAQQMGITTLTDPDRYGLSLVLGGAEVHPIDMASAYSVFANDGLRNPWRIVLSVKDANGNVLEEAPSQPQAERVLPAQTARLMDNILSDNNARAPEFGYNSALYVPGYSVAAKTGTTEDDRDGWVVGFSPNIATAVWTGNNDNTPMTRAGAGISAAGPMWHQFMVNALATLPNDSFPAPDPVSSNKPMLSGSYSYTTNTSSAISFHSILYYVDRTDPTGPMPSNPNQDPLFNNWEWSVQNNYARYVGGYMETPTPSPTPTL
ncbi:MAG TPA: transglycosylase domain-containing protein [Candidatus Paceibacterota bacterium]|nr:transglycosylase domain-containing protein [Candidatus Paceibacterota bacterium]